MLANQLQRRHVNYRLVDSRGDREYRCKAMGISPRTLEIFDQMGVLDEALDRGLFFTALNTVVSGQPVDRVEVTPNKDPYGAMALSQFDTEDILEADLRRWGGRIERRTTLRSMRNTPLFIEAEFEGPSGLEVVHSRWLVGCDGSHSLVRKSLDLPFDGDQYEQTFLLGDVEIEWCHPHSEVWKLITRSEGAVTQVVVAVPIPGNPRRYRLSLAVPPECQQAHADPLELLRQLAGPSLPPGTRLDHLRWSSFYRISHRLVPRYRVGRVLLAGDAAHIHPPFGGLGMNTGLQDAYNLGWKLAAVARGEALEGLLETYHQERHPVGEQVVNLTAARMDDAAAGRLRDPQAEERANTQLWVHYRGSSLAVGEVPPGDRGAEPGDRVDFIEGLERAYVRRQARLIDLLRVGPFHLVGYGGDWADFAVLVERVRPYFGAELRAWAVLSPGESVSDLPEDIARLQDGLGQARDAWGEGPGALLVRPDGHVGWRGRPRLDPALEGLLKTVSLNHS
jgi:2-polyprenyl-6-methoxyphenol hydroxylase-like FAD-dependent oxidoreductase